MTHVKKLTVEQLLEIKSNLKIKFLKYFFRFLKDNNAYDSYLNYSLCHPQNYLSSRPYCDSEADMKYKLLHKYHPDAWISIFFNWGTTFEGHSFWLDLDYNWRLISHKYHFTQFNGK